MDSRPPGDTQLIRTHSVIVEDEREPFLGDPLDLSSKARVTVELGIGLPAVDEPRLDLELISGKPLNSNAVKKPRSVRGNIRRLVSPVVEVVVTEQADIRHENARVDVQPMVHIEVISAPGFGKVFVGVV